MENPEKKEFWFVRKHYGWGWYPANQKGWTVTIVYILTTCVAAYFAEQIGLGWFFTFAVISLAIFLGICVKKGEKPRWQWGSQKDSDR